MFIEIAPSIFVTNSQDLANKEALPWGGIPPYDHEECRAALRKYSSYECCVPYTAFNLWHFCHQAVLPALGRWSLN